MMTSTRHSFLFLLTLCGCSLGPFVIGENDSDGASGDESDSGSDNGLSISASTSAEETSGGSDDCVGDCVPAFAWCYEHDELLIGIEWDPQAKDVVALYGRALTTPQVHRIDPAAGTPSESFALADTPEDWHDLDFSFGKNGGVALAYGPSPYRVQTRPSDMSAVYAEFVRPLEDPTTFTAKDVVLDGEGRTIVAGYLEDLIEDPLQLVSATFVDAWDIEGNLVAETVLPLGPHNTEILGVADDGASVVWIEGTDQDSLETAQFVRWLDASGHETAAHEVPVFPIIGPAARDGEGFHYVRDVQQGLSLHHLDGDLVEIDVGYDRVEAGDVEYDPHRVIVSDGRVYVVAIYDPMGASELQLRSYGTDELLDEVVPFPPLAIDTPGQIIVDVLTADGAIFVAGYGGAAGATDSFVCRIDP